MKSVAMFGEKRSSIGKRNSKDLRNEGKVPCVLYGNDTQPVHFFIYASDFSEIVYTPNTYTAKLTIDGNVYKAILKDVQYHAVNETIIHADFMSISTDKPVTLDIPVKVVGNSPGVRAGGKLEKKIKKLKVKGLIANIPDSIEVNIDHVELGKSVKVGEMKGEGIEFLDAAANAIISVVATRNTRQEANAGK
ncbi:MAG: 50S ribosomal protein L25/general stress protein Ctc [Bacteroidetes bacterium]|nr:50S ribosomal protein L25/general stress protein Ctc [Bacteroidota bacterium]